MTVVMINTCVQLKIDIDEEIETSEMLQCKGQFALLKKVNLDIFSEGKMVLMSKSSWEGWMLVKVGIQ